MQYFYINVVKKWKYFQLLMLFLLFTFMHSKWQKVIFLWIFSIQRVNTSFPLKCQCLISIFSTFTEKKMTGSQIYMPCSAALEMHIQPGTKRFKERETALTYGNRIRKNCVANISFIRMHIQFPQHHFHKAQKCCILFLFFNGKAKVRLSFFSHIPLSHRPLKW